jgi:GAF domain-containing protein
VRLVPREAVLLRTLVELADNLVDDFDVIDVLTILNMRCVETLDVAAAGVMLAAPSGQLHVVASSTDTMRVLELFELQANEGPCVDCHRSGQPIVNLELSAVGGRWPRFSARAMAEGFNSVHALPMRFRSLTIGALNMFRIGTGALNDNDVIAAQALADVASIAIAQYHAAVDAQVLSDQLNQALTGRTIIEQAKGRISEAAGIDMDRAFQRLRLHAQAHHLRLTDLSRDVADGSLAIASLDHTP